MNLADKVKLEQMGQKGLEDKLGHKVYPEKLVYQEKLVQLVKKDHQDPKAWVEIPEVQEKQVPQEKMAKTVNQANPESMVMTVKPARQDTTVWMDHRVRVDQRVKVETLENQVYQEPMALMVNLVRKVCAVCKDNEVRQAKMAM